MHMFRRVAGVYLLLACSAAAVWARSPGAPAGVSGAPGDGLCTNCHAGSANSGQGRVALSFANGSTYAPGQTQRVTVTITDSAGQRWGFEVSPRLASDAANSGAGSLAVSNSNAQVLPVNGTKQWVTHTSAGTRPGTSGPATFEFDWTAPATDVGPVEFYAAANAANNSNSNSGDSIYTTKIILTPAAANTTKPAISDAGVVNGASFQAGIAAGSWISIVGTNLATNTRIWDDKKDFSGDRLPTALDGTSVKVNGKDAAVYFISPTQINVQAPDDSSTGNVNVVVTTPAGDSPPMVAALQQFAPAFFPFEPQSRKYAAAVGSSDGVFLGPNGLFGSTVTTRPAKPGEIILLFGTGFGPTNPAVPAGQVFSGAAPLTNAVSLTIGGVTADVAFAGLSGAGLYQFNVTVPATVANGDQALAATIGGIKTQDNLFLSVQR